MNNKLCTFLVGIVAATSLFAVESIDGGYTYYFSGEQATVPVLDNMASNVCQVTLENAHFNAGFTLPAGKTVIFKPKKDTTNTFSNVTGSDKAVMQIDGKGVISLEGSDTLLKIPYLTVTEGTLKLKSTGVSKTKTSVAEIKWDIKQEGGVIDLDIDVPGNDQIYGFRIGKEKAGKASFAGGEFRAKIGGWKSAALYVDSFSTNKVVEFKKKLVIDASLNGPEARFVNAKSDLTLKNCMCNIYMPGQYSSLTNARVFKSDKSISIEDGNWTVNAPGPGSEIFSAANEIRVSGGTFNLFSDDDCFSATTNIVVEAGNIYATSNDDVFDSNGTMTINGGTILAYTTASGHEAFDVDPEETSSGAAVHTLTINGGTIFATGGPGSSWPANFSCASTLKKMTLTGTQASQYAGKFLSFNRTDSYVSHALLPVGNVQRLLVIAPLSDMDGDFYVPATAPREAAMRFQNYYVTSSLKTNQESVRFYEIYGSTTGTGDEGEYIVLTNISSTAVNLVDFKVSTTKDGDTSPTLNITLADGLSIPANGTVTLTQADYAALGWTKITNGEIVLALTDLEGATVQSGKADFARYPQADGLGASLIATNFVEVIRKSEWVPSFYPPAIEIGVPAGSSVPAFAITSTGASVALVNGDASRYEYSYKCADTIAGLADAELQIVTDITGSDGVLFLNLLSEASPSMFYQLFVNFKKVTQP